MSSNNKSSCTSQVKDNDSDIMNEVDDKRVTRSMTGNDPTDEVDDKRVSITDNDDAPVDDRPRKQLRVRNPITRNNVDAPVENDRSRNRCNPITQNIQNDNNSISINTDDETNDDTDDERQSGNDDPFEAILKDDSFEANLKESIDHRLRPIKPHPMADSDWGRVWPLEEILTKPDPDPIRRSIHDYLDMFIIKLDRYNFDASDDSSVDTENNENSLEINPIKKVFNDRGKLTSLRIDIVETGNFDQNVSYSLNYESVFQGNSYASVFPRNKHDQFLGNILLALSNVCELDKESEYYETTNIKPINKKICEDINKLRGVYHGNPEYTNDYGILPTAGSNIYARCYKDEYEEIQPQLTAVYKKIYKEGEDSDYQFESIKKVDYKAEYPKSDFEDKREDGFCITYQGKDKTEIYDNILIDLYKYWAKTYEAYFEWEIRCKEIVSSDDTDSTECSQVLEKFLKNRRAHLDLFSLIIIYLIKTDKINSFFADNEEIQKDIRNKVKALEELPLGDENAYIYII